MTMKKIFDQKNVLAHMQENIGTRYTAAVLAGIFKVGAATMREMLSELLTTKKIDCVSGHSKFFFVPKPFVDPMNTYKYNQPFKKLTLKSREWAGAIDRCRELYPDGHSFGNMTGGKS